MNYQETLDYLYSQLPIYQRVGKSAYKADLTNTIKLCKILDNPERSFKSVHVAGTNGKGSTSHLIASIFQEAGYKTGLYTSPHLIDFRERIKINGQPIPQQNVIQFVETYKTAFKNAGISFFEMTVGMAFDYFSKQQVDIAIIETGLGGRLDSTNIISPELSVITNVSLDHVALLGDTIEQIAVEKAGIIKNNVPVIIGETQNKTKPIFTKIAQEQNAEITFADRADNIATPSHIKISYQQKNVKTALVAIDRLKSQGWRFSAVNISEGVNNITKNTGLKGRWQKLLNTPLTICDTGHNVAGITHIVDELENLNYDKLHFVLGTVNDKDIDEILALLPRHASYYFCKAAIPRALDQHKLKQLASNHQLNGTEHSTVFQATKTALAKAKGSDAVFIGGSTFVVGEVLENFNELFGDTSK